MQCYYFYNLILQTDEVEIKVIMTAQRARVAENGWETSYQMDHRGRSEKVTYLSILRREGIRKLPGICQYPSKRLGQPEKSRWHRG